MTVMPSGVNLTPDNNGVSRTDAASAENGPQLEALYAQWKRDPASVDPQTASFFSGFELGCQQPPKRSGAGKVSSAVSAGAVSSDHGHQSRVDALISAYRRLGHQAAKIDPLNLLKRSVPEIALEYVKLGQPVWESNLVSELKRATSQQMQRNRPLSCRFHVSPV